MVSHPFFRDGFVVVSRALVVAAAVLGVMAGRVRADEPLPVRIDAMMEARRFAEVRPLIEAWCAELDRQSGPEAALAQARARHVLGSVQDRLGEHAEAMSTLTRALALYDRAGAGAEERAAVLDEAGRAAQAAGDFAQAETWLRAAAEARVGQPALAAGSRAQLSDVLLKSGRLDEAAAELRAAAAAAGDDPAAQWQVARQRGVLALTAGRHVEALGWIERARAAAGRLGAEAGPLLASLDGQRGQVLYLLGQSGEAARALAAAADYFRERPEAGGEWLAHENNLAAVWLAGGEAGRARDRLRVLLASPAAAALGDSPALITPWLNASAAEWAAGDRGAAAAALDRASGLAEAVLPAVHPLRAQVALAHLAAARERGDAPGARAAARRASDLARAWLDRLGAAADESQWLEFRRTLDPVSPLAVVGSEETAALADAVLATQGLALERLLAGPRGAREAVAPRPGRSELADALPPGTVLVNYVWWRPLLPGGRWADTGQYGALVFRAGAAPVWIDLGPAAEVEARVRRVIHAARDTVSANRAARNRASLDFQLGQLWELVWARLVPHVEGAERVLLRTDGMLHFVPWAILRDRGETGAGSGRLFCQRYPHLRVVARVAPQAGRPPGEAAGWRVVAVPGAPGSGAPGPPDDDSGGLSPLLWRDLLAMPALPGVHREVEAIRAAAPGPVAVATPSGREADIVPARPAPPLAVLHFSGHGFALEQEDEWGVRQLEAGLVLADCADGLKARAAGRPLSPERDGILFAREAAALDLHGTDLVMLSACQTGLGQWQPGEHLAGLRHAFIVAGARHVATTLWDVNDEAAPAFIGAFYRRLGAGEAPAEALWSTQREWLEAPSDDPSVRAALAGAWTLEASGW